MVGTTQRWRENPLLARIPKKHLSGLVHSKKPPPTLKELPDDFPLVSALSRQNRCKFSNIQIKLHSHCSHSSRQITSFRTRLSHYSDAPLQGRSRSNNGRRTPSRRDVRSRTSSGRSRPKTWGRLQEWVSKEGRSSTTTTPMPLFFPGTWTFMEERESRRFNYFNLSIQKPLQLFSTWQAAPNVTSVPI